MQKLSVSQAFIPVIQQFTNQAANLQNLSLQLGDLLLSTAPDISHLQQLTCLSLTCCSVGDTMARLLDKCPPSLECLSIASTAHNAAIGLNFSQEAFKALCKHSQLTSLGLRYCSLCIPDCTLSCLHQLSSLTLRYCSVQSMDSITQLTNLTVCDVTHCIWCPLELCGCHFVAWPALRVIKSTGYDSDLTHTALDMGHVSEVHTNFLAAGMEVAQIYLYNSCLVHGTPELFDYICDRQWSQAIVDLHLDIVIEGGLCPNIASSYATFQYLASFVNNLSSTLPTLRVCRLEVDPAGVGDDAEVKISLGRKQPSCLQEFYLHGIPCSEVDLGESSLIEIGLSYIDHDRLLCKLSLPSSTQSFHFCGHSLYCAEAQTSLQHLSSLSDLVLGSAELFAGRSQKLGLACLPKLPASLRHFSVTCGDLFVLLCAAAVECLSSCSNLEHLKLPQGCSLDAPEEGDLHAWVKAARFLHTVQVESSWQE